MSVLLIIRTKVQVLNDLPKKINTVIRCNFTPVQKKQYEQAEQDGEFVSSDALLEARNLTSSKMMNLRKVANHPLMNRVQFTDEMISEMSLLCLRELDFIDEKAEHLLEVLHIKP